MRQQIHSQISQSEASLFLGLIQQNKFTNSSRNGLLICASKLQVHLSVLISDRICLTVILTVKFIILEFRQ